MCIFTKENIIDNIYTYTLSLTSQNAERRNKSLAWHTAAMFHQEWVFIRCIETPTEMFGAFATTFPPQLGCWRMWLCSQLPTVSASVPRKKRKRWILRRSHADKALKSTPCVRERADSVRSTWQLASVTDGLDYIARCVVWFCRHRTVHNLATCTGPNDSPLYVVFTLYPNVARTRWRTGQFCATNFVDKGIIVT